MVVVFGRKYWAMRQIEMMAQGLARMLFRKNSPVYEVSEESDQTETDLIYSIGR